MERRTALYSPVLNFGGYKRASKSSRLEDQREVSKSPSDADDPSTQVSASAVLPPSTLPAATTSQIARNLPYVDLD